MSRVAALALCLATLAAISVAPAQAQGDAKNGATIAQQWCTGCHVAGSKGTDMAPPFDEIVAREGRDEGWFYVWLTDPHPPMPRLDLSRQDIADLIAYLLTLQAE